MHATLKAIGLENNEITIYLNLLSNGKSTVSILCYKTKIPRSTIQFTCKQLLKNGLISSIKKGNAIYYIAEAPEKISYLLDREKEKIKERENKLNRVIGDLKFIANPQSILPKVRYYEDYSGIKKSYKDLINECNEKEMMAIFAVVEEVGVDLQNFFVKEYIPQRVGKGIRMKNICLKSPKAIQYKKNDKKELRETKFVSKEDFPIINTEINLYGDTMHYMSFDHNQAFAMIVKDKYISSMLRAIFTMLWKQV